MALHTPPPPPHPRPVMYLHPASPLPARQQFGYHTEAQWPERAPFSFHVDDDWPASHDFFEGFGRGKQAQLMRDMVALYKMPRAEMLAMDRELRERVRMARKRFLPRIYGSMAFYVACWFWFVASLEAAPPPEPFRESTDELQFVFALLQAVSFGAYVVWTMRRGHQLDLVTSVLGVLGNLFGLLSFGFLHYRVDRFSPAIVATIGMTLTDLVVVFLWSLTSHLDHLPRAGQWFHVMIASHVVSGLTFTVMFMFGVLSTEQILIAWAIALFNFFLLVLLTNTFLKGNIYRLVYLEQKEQRGCSFPHEQETLWTYVHTTYGTSTVFVLVVVASAMALHFPRIVRRFRQSKQDVVDVYVERDFDYSQWAAETNGGGVAMRMV